MPEKTANPNQTHEARPKHEAAKPAAPQSAELTPALDLAALPQIMAAPRLARPVDILRLQRTVGNRATTRLIQAKLRVGPAGDRYEREADRVAAQVMTMPAPAETQPALQRAPEGDEELQMKPLAASITPLVQRAPEDEEDLQTKPDVQRAATGLALRWAAVLNNNSPRVAAVVVPCRLKFERSWSRALGQTSAVCESIRVASQRHSIDRSAHKRSRWGTTSIWVKAKTIWNPRRANNCWRMS